MPIGKIRAEKVFNSDLLSLFVRDRDPNGSKSCVSYYFKVCTEPSNDFTGGFTAYAELEPKGTPS